MHKRRDSFTQTHTTHVVGDISGRRPIIIDDMIASGSVLKQLDPLYERGAQGRACFAITHPILLPSALEILEADDRIEKLVVTNTIPIPSEKRHPKIECISIAPLLAAIIKKIHEGVSISSDLIPI
jgi:ribose-phosphate pyrophosphokinase